MCPTTGVQLSTATINELFVQVSAPIVVYHNKSGSSVLSFLAFHCSIGPRIVVCFSSTMVPLTLSCGVSVMISRSRTICWLLTGDFYFIIRAGPTCRHTFRDPHVRFRLQWHLCPQGQPNLLYAYTGWEHYNIRGSCGFDTIYSSHSRIR